MTKWFGSPWPSADCRAGVCEDDALRITTPVGAFCYLCNEPIVEGDQGTAIQGVGLDAAYDPISLGEYYTHKECSLRNVIGCYGNLSEPGHHTHDESYREDARMVQEWVHENGTLGNTCDE